jgi:hypothetical protein
LQRRMVECLPCFRVGCLPCKAMKKQQAGLISCKAHWTC